jgi:hypothetical protein
MDIWQLVRIMGQFLAHNGVNDEPVEVALALLAVFAIAWILIIVIGDRQKAEQAKKPVVTSNNSNDERLS